MSHFEVQWKANCTSFDIFMSDLNWNARLRFSISLRCNYKNNQYLTCAKSDTNLEIQISRQNNQVQLDLPRTPHMDWPWVQYQDEALIIKVILMKDPNDSKKVRD